MKPMSLKFLVAGLLLGLSVTYLGAVGIKSGSVYSMSVDRYLAERTFRPQRVRLHGKVAEDGFRSSPGLLSAQFVLEGETGRIDVAYRGVIPDLFQAKGDVVVEGRSDDQQVFQADVLMTKCASKYEPDSPHVETEERP